MNTKKAIRIIIYIIAAILLLRILVFGVMYAAYLIKDKKDYNRALEYFNGVCDYVEENREAFTEFSEYQISLLNGSTDYIEIERKGEMQELRSIVLLKMNSAEAYFNNENKPMVIYRRQYGSYKITIKYSDNIADGKGNSFTFVGDDIMMYMIRTER